MKERIEELINEKIEELSQKDNLSLEELTFLISQFDRKEAKKFQDEHKELITSLMSTM